MRKYKSILIVKNTTDQSDIQVFIFNYIQLLIELGADNFDAWIQDNCKFNENWKKFNSVKCITVFFSITPKAIKEVNKQLKLDEKILRYFIMHREI